MTTDVLGMLNSREIKQCYLKIIMFLSFRSMLNSREAKHITSNHIDEACFRSMLNSREAKPQKF